MFGTYHVIDLSGQIFMDTYILVETEWEELKFLTE